MLKQIFTQYNIVFMQQDDVIKYMDLFKEKLEPFFEESAYSTLGLPSSIQIPPEIPRIIVISTGQHSKLEISLLQISLSTKFDLDFQSDFQKCYEYLQKRIKIIDSIAKEISNETISFNGIVTQFVDDSYEHATKDILQNLYKTKIAEKPIYDVMSKLTYQKDKVYYINVTIENMRKDENHESLGLQLDINSRYSFNYDKNHKFAKQSMLDGTLQLYHDIVSNHLKEIMKGEFSI